VFALPGTDGEDFAVCVLALVTDPIVHVDNGVTWSASFVAGHGWVSAGVNAVGIRSFAKWTATGFLAEGEVSSIPLTGAPPWGSDPGTAVDGQSGYNCFPRAGCFLSGRGQEVALKEQTFLAVWADEFSYEVAGTPVTFTAEAPHMPEPSAGMVFVLALLGLWAYLSFTGIRHGV
jgi:hypothetical protein